MSAISADLTQQSDGTIGGRWTAKVSSPNVPCPPQLGSNPTGPVSGDNTVLEIHLSLLGVGDFEGQDVDNKALKGSMTSCGGTYPITFSLAPSVPGG